MALVLQKSECPTRRSLTAEFEVLPSPRLARGIKREGYGEGQYSKFGRREFLRTFTAGAAATAATSLPQSASAVNSTQAELTRYRPGIATCTSLLSRQSLLKKAVVKRGRHVNQALRTSRATQFACRRSARPISRKFGSAQLPTKIGTCRRWACLDRRVAAWACEQGFGWPTTVSGFEGHHPKKHLHVLFGWLHDRQRS